MKNPSYYQEQRQKTHIINNNQKINAQNLNKKRSIMNNNIKQQKQKEKKIINWVPIRLNNIPLVHLQVNNINIKISSLQKQIQKGNLQAISTLQALFLQIKNRIFQIDHFYNNKFHDPRVHHLQNTKILLQKFLFFNKGTFQNGKYQINNEKISNYQFQLKQNTKHKKDMNINNSKYYHYQRNNSQQKQTQKNNQIYQQVSKSKQKSISISKSNKKHKSSKKLQSLITNKNCTQININNNQNGINYNQNLSIPSSRKAYSPINLHKNNNQIPTININKAHTNKNTINNSLNLTPISKPKTEVNKNISYQKSISNKNQKISIKSHNRSQQQNYRQGNNNNNKTSFQNDSSSTLKNLSELVFTIKMTKQEYNNFMKMKSQANQFRYKK